MLFGIGHICKRILDVCGLENVVKSRYRWYVDDGFFHKDCKEMIM